MSNNDFILAKPLYGGDIAFLLLNDTDSPKKMPLSWSYAGWDINDTVSFRDLINHSDFGIHTRGICVTVQPHCAAVLRATRL